MTNATARSASALLLVTGLFACDIPTAPPRFQPTFVVDVEPVSLPVTSTATSTFVSRTLTDLDPDVAERATGGAVVLRIENPHGASGIIGLRVDGGGEMVEAAVDIASSSSRIVLSDKQMRAFLKGSFMIRAAGTLCPGDGCGLRPPPFPEVTVRPRLEITIEIGGH